MDCGDFSLENKSIHDWIWDMSDDEFIALSALQEHPVLLVSDAPVGRTVLFEMHCKGLLMRSEFPDKDVAYKPMPGVILEFAQYLRERPGKTS